jgi:glycosyltransferase involved in cell wall biosynthesis
MLFLLHYFTKFRLIDRVAIGLVRVIVCAYLKAFLRNNREFCVWTRDIRIAISTAKLGLKTICEIHVDPTHRERKALDRLRSNQYLAFAPISKILTSKVELIVSDRNIECAVFSLPMAVNNLFFTKYPRERNSDSYRIIGYFGSYSSSGSQSGLEEFLSSMAKICLHERRYFVRIFGVGQHGRIKLQTLLNNFNCVNLKVKIFDRIQHSQVARHMQQCDVLILPYPETKFNRDRFPIKAVEYAASRVPILCSNTESNHEIFDDSRATFYEIGDVNSLKTAFEKIFSNRSETDKKVQNSFNWSRQFTYTNRAKTMWDFYSL